MTESMPDFAEYEPARHGRPRRGIVVREARAADVEAIVRLESSVRLTAPATWAMAAAVADGDRLVLVALADDEVVGWAKTHHWTYGDGPAEPGHYLGGVTVHPDLRRCGVGSALTAARMAWIGERADRAWYVVNARNVTSVDLHRAWGFEEVARAARFHTIDFTGGVGILLRAALP